MYVQFETLLARSVYEYLYTLVPLQVIGSGVSTVLNNTPEITPSHLSVAVGTVGGTAAAGHDTVEPPFEAVTGAWLSLTTTLKEHVPGFPAKSFAVYVRGVGPLGKILPAGGL